MPLGNITFTFVETEQLNRIELQLEKIRHKLHTMAETQDQEAADLTALVANMATVKQGIIDLETQIQNAGNVPPNVQAALDALKASVADTVATLPAPPPGP
jgi:hypothetical protein